MGLLQQAHIAQHRVSLSKLGLVGFALIALVYLIYVSSASVH